MLKLDFFLYIGGTAWSRGIILPPIRYVAWKRVCKMKCVPKIHSKNPEWFVWYLGFIVDIKFHVSIALLLAVRSDHEPVLPVYGYFWLFWSGFESKYSQFHLKCHERSQCVWFRIQVEIFIFTFVMQYVFDIADYDLFIWWNKCFWKVMGIGPTLLPKPRYTTAKFVNFLTKVLPFGWLRNPVKVLFVPITEAQMDELQGLSEQGSLKASVFVSIYCFSDMSFGKESPKHLQISQGPHQDYEITMIVLRGIWTWQTG